MTSKKKQKIKEALILNESKIQRVTNKILRRMLKRRKSSYSVEEWAEVAKVRQIKRLPPS